MAGARSPGARRPAGGPPPRGTCDGRGPVEWLPLDHREPHARRESLLREVLETVGMLVPDFLKQHRSVHVDLGQRHELRFFDFAGGWGARRARRSWARLAARFRNAFDRFVGDGVLEPLRLDVDVAPVEAEPAREI